MDNLERKWQAMTVDVSDDIRGSCGRRADSRQQRIHSLEKMDNEDAAEIDVIASAWFRRCLFAVRGRWGASPPWPPPAASAQCSAGAMAPGADGSSWSDVIARLQRPACM